MTEAQAAEILEHLALIAEHTAFLRDWIAYVVFCQCLVCGLLIWQIILEAMRSKNFIA